MGLANRKMGRKEGSWFFVLGASLVPPGIGAWFFVLRKYGVHRSVARQAVGLAADRLALVALAAATLWRSFFCECGFLRWWDARWQGGLLRPPSGF